jgi:molybdenum-dependent DNA-binding transcriptional regulator ModE
MPDKPEHVKIIEQLIEKHGTLNKVAKATKIKYHTMWRLLKGDNKHPHHNTMEALKKALKVKKGARG